LYIIRRLLAPAFERASNHDGRATVGIIVKIEALFAVIKDDETDKGIHQPQTLFGRIMDILIPRQFLPDGV
jgi:hypothetical protein